MKQKMFAICTLHLVIGGAFMLGGCTGVQEDEPMPKDARIVKQEPAKQTEVQQTEVQQTEVQKPETEPQQVAPVVNEPVEIDVPIEKPEVIKPPVQDPVIEVKPTPVPVPVQPQVREADVEYIIKKGDTYTKISKEFGVSLKDLMAYNTYPEKKLIPGRKLMIPATGKKITAKAVAPAAVKVQKAYEAIPADGVYVVKKNDSYSKIAGRFGLRASDIAEYNNLPLTKAIQPGQKLRLPPKRATAGKPSAKPTAKKNAEKPAVNKPAVNKPAASKPVENAKPAANKPAADTDSMEDLQAPSIDNIDIPTASISTPAQDATVAEIVTEDTTVAKLALEYASTELDIRKQNPHLAADGNVKRGTRIVL